MMNRNVKTTRQRVVREPLASIGSRLFDAIYSKFDSVQTFQQVLQREGVKGSSPSSVYAYVDGRAVPNLEFLVAAAEHLNVSAAWLAFGEYPQRSSAQEKDFRMQVTAERLGEISVSATSLVNELRDLAASVRDQVGDE